MRRHCLAACLLAATPALAESPHLRLTTESAAYCSQLAARVAAQPGAGREPARRLAQEGRRLCAEGQVRTGIAKLRRALRATYTAGG